MQHDRAVSTEKVPLTGNSGMEAKLNKMKAARREALQVQGSAAKDWVSSFQRISSARKSLVSASEGERGLLNQRKRRNMMALAELEEARHLYLESLKYAVERCEYQK